LKISPSIFAISIGAAMALSGTASLAKTATGKMVEPTSNPFTQTLQLATKQRSAMKGQFLDLQEGVGRLFAGKSVDDVVTALQDVQRLDAAVRPVSFNANAIGDELKKGHQIALGFNAAQIQAITGSDVGLHKDDIVLIILSTDTPARTIQVDTATLRNATLYP
jgi:hypothetical protein